MMQSNIAYIVKLADQLIRRYGTRDPYELCDALGISILPRPFKEQRGAYCVILRKPFIFVKSDLDPIMEYIVLYHELGHHHLHRNIAEHCGGFKEFCLFNMQNNRMEYEANVFASQLDLPTDEFLEYIYQGYDCQKIAHLMDSDANLVSLKVDTLIAQGYDLQRQDHDSGSSDSISNLDTIQEPLGPHNGNQGVASFYPIHRALRTAPAER